MIEDYEQILNEFQDIISRQKIESEGFNGSELIEGRIEFISGWRLEFMEFKSENKHKYRFHLMDSENKMITRWDTAPHHPELENFPFHKHTRNTENPKDTKELEGRKTLRKALEKALENL